ncbi:MAG: PLP-dependent aminotransferase family protein [Gemmatimonadetes bacterium]|nr:PLP-dependent aminotransferase family protein [Gemmatimonadota bacterium]
MRRSTRRRGSGAPTIALPLASEREELPLYAQLYQNIREHILSGSLAAGATIPSARTMAADLRLSRNTIEAALGLLVEDGFVTRRVGAGTVVADVRDLASLAPRWRRAPAPATPARDPLLTEPAAPPAPLSARGARLAAAGLAERDADHRGLPTTVDVTKFPLGEWNRLLARASRERGLRALQSGDPQGDRALRRAVAEHVRLARGVRCTADQVLIVNSTQQALDLTSRLLLAAGDLVLVEEPGYPSARAVFTAGGATVSGLPVDRHGARTDRLEEFPGTRMLYLTPSHQFPLGVTLTLRRRMAALAWARAHGAWIVEDDYDSEFRYDGRPIAALQGLDRHGRVLYIGTFNKVLFPGLRLAYLIVPEALADSYTSARRLTDGGSPPNVQTALAAFIRSGHFAAHLRRMRLHYRTRRDALVRRLTALGDAIRLGASDTGLHLVAHLADGVDDERLAAAGAGFGLGIAPLSNYFAEHRAGEPVPRGLLLTFGASSIAEIGAGAAAFSPLLRPPRAAARRATRAPSP